MRLIHLKLRPFIFALLICSSFSLLIFQEKTYGQATSSDIASYVKVDARNVPDGSVVNFSDNGYRLSSLPYDPTAFAISTSNPAITTEENPNDGSVAVVSTGKALVRVNTSNGPIRSGNLVTTSKVAGVAQKASQDGYVIGTALEAYTEANQTKEGKIYISLNFGFHTQSTTLRSNLLENISTTLQSPFLSPGTSFRYILAGLIVLISLIVGILFFGRVAGRGVEALGRNPLASKQILLGIGFNLLLTLAVLGIGLAIAYLILIL